MKDIMLADTPVEQRAQILRDSCDEVVEKSYLSKFSQEETNELRANLVEVQIQMQELTENFDVVKADFKGKMKPLQERIGKMLDDLRKGGEYIKGECYKFIDQDEGRVGYYTPEGYSLGKPFIRSGDSAGNTDLFRGFGCKRLLCLCCVTKSINYFNRFLSCVMFDVNVQTFVFFFHNV